MIASWPNMAARRVCAIPACSSRHWRGPQQLHACGDPPPDLADLAASLAYGLARNHPFVDGNKRTAQVCHRVFLALNNAQLVASDTSKYTRMLALAEGSLIEAGFAAWLRAHLQQDEENIHEPPAHYRKNTCKHADGSQ